MSLMKTLAKVAVGVAVAKGASAMMKGGSSRSTSSGSDLGGLLGGLMGQMQGGSATTQSRGGLEDMLGQVLGGGTSGGGLGGLLEQLGGTASARRAPTGSSGGLGDILGSLAGSGAAAGGLGGMLGGLLAQAQGSAGAQGGFGDMLNQAMVRQDEPDHAPTRQQEVAAGLMLRAMLQAAKSDGQFDQTEQARILDKLGDVSAEERAFVEAELRAPVDVNALAQEVPRGLEPQIYAMSVLAIEIDSRAEVEYLHGLARAMGLDMDEVNEIHAHLGVPSIYS